MLRATMQSKQFKMMVIGAFFLLSFIAWLGMQVYSHYYISTDDAYVNANTIQIAPRIVGSVMGLNVKNNQYVKKGDVLFSIDPTPYQLAVHSAKASLMLAEAELTNMTATDKRVSALVKKQYLSAQDGDNANARYQTALAKVEEAKAQLDEATLNLNYTKVTAPTSGWITNLSLQTGSVVSANQPLFALISDEEFWVDVNFKETQMSAIKAGQKATVTVDMYPKHAFQGVVDSISGGTGTAFSLLPPQNASGNWVKVTQRVPVRVRILNTDTHYPLRIGTSAKAIIHLQSFVSA